MINFPEKFLARMRDILGVEYEIFLASYDRNAYKAIRVNTLKISVDKFRDMSPFTLEPVDWADCGFYVVEEKAGKTIEHAAGLYYVQEPSAMSAAPLLEVMPGDKVLDMCAAPGGKGTQLAQKMCGEGIIVLNEINFQRAKILSQNAERLGIANSIVTCASPEVIAQSFEGYFDKVLVDAPCSGEGMFLKEANAVEEWSVENVLSCAVRQSKILESAQKALKCGGLLVYSTCTFAPEEDEIQIENFLKTHPDFELLKTEKLYPHKIKGEGHFVALLKKNCGNSGELPILKPNLNGGKRLDAYRQFEKQYLSKTFSNLYLVGDRLYSLPEGCPAVTAKMHILRIGVCLGLFTGDRFEPDHALAMCIKSGDADCIEVDAPSALNYLKGLTLNCEERFKGWRLITYLEHPLGWCKCVNGTAKNHLPKGLRI